MHEIVELIKALAWPCVVMYFIVKFRSQIGSLLGEMPSVVRRMRSAHALGLEIELDRIGEELPLAERQAQQLSLQLPTVPTREKTEGNN